MTLHVKQIDLDRLNEHAGRALPEECCGLLIGRRDGADAHVEGIAPADNIAEADHTRNYQIDWRTLFECVRRTREADEEIIGFYHSHPDGSSTPSAQDAASAWIDYAYLIVPAGSCATKAPTCWRIPPGRTYFEPEPVAAH